MMSRNFDVFLSHNSQDKPAVRDLATALRERGLKVWLDEWVLSPGEDWQVALEQTIETVRAAAVVVGKDGIGPWEDQELRAVLGEFVRRKLLVVPILLPGVENPPPLPLFLRRFTWLDLRSGMAAEELDRLEHSLRSRQPRRRSSYQKRPEGRARSLQVSIDYLGFLAERLNRTPWFLGGKAIQLSEVHVPPYVWKTELYVDDLAQGSPAHDLPKDQHADTRASPYEFSPKPELRKFRVRWLDEFERGSQMAPLVVTGGPGSGKSSLLAWTARRIALSAKTQLEARTATELKVEWPIFVNLDTWGRQPGRARESFISAALQTTPIPEDWTDRQRVALEDFLGARLGGHTENTFLFLDAVDQVGESRAHTVRRRLSELNGFSSRMIVSTRESGLSTLQPILPFPHLTLVETAALLPEEARALADAWLGSPQGSEFEEHLRSQPSLALVAESPLLLTLACLMASSEARELLPHSISALYRSIMRHLALGSWRETSSSNLAAADVEAFLSNLRRLVWDLFLLDPGANEFEREAFVTSMTRAAGLSVSEGQGMLSRLIDLGFVEPSGTETEETVLHFRHATFREFLAAWHLAAQINAEGWTPARVASRGEEGNWGTARIASILDMNAFEPQWEPLVVFLAGLLKQPNPLLQVLADRQKDDLSRHRLDLLCRCYGTLPSEEGTSLSEIRQSLLREIRASGIKALRRSPERWRRWLANIANLMQLPASCKGVVELLIEMAASRHRREGMLHFEHDVVRLLAKATRGPQRALSVSALLHFCEVSLGHHHELGEAAKAVVDAGDWRSIASLAEILEEGQEGQSWRGVPIARALLGCAREQVVEAALAFLLKRMEAPDSEAWLKSSALNALAGGLGGPREGDVEDLIFEFLVDPFVSFSPRNDLAHEILRAAESSRSGAVENLMRTAFIFSKNDPGLVSRFAEIFASWKDERGVRRATRYLWRLARATDTDCYPRVKALEGILVYGRPGERTEALSMLNELAGRPVADGRAEWLALEALLNAGQPYAGLREKLMELTSSPKVHPHWLTRGCELALQHEDRSLVESMVPELLLMSTGHAPTQGVPEPDWSDKRRVAPLLRDTRHWSTLEEMALATLRGPAKSQENWYAVDVLVAGAKSSRVLQVTRELLKVGTRSFRPWHPLLRELDRRGWRLRIRIDRTVEVLRRGKEEPRPDSSDSW